KIDEDENPSLEVASLFGIKPNRLPGIVIFRKLPQRGALGEGVYLPLKAKFFDDMGRIENQLSDLFSVIQECSRASDDSTNLLENLRDKVAGLRRRQQLIPVLKYLKEGLMEVVKLPAILAKTMSEAFAKEAAKRVIDGK